MENKQTALNWILDKLAPYIYYPYAHSSGYDVEELIEQAKAMEKEQMGKFYNEGRDFTQYTHDEQFDRIEYWDREPLGFEDYYNETYGK